MKVANCNHSVYVKFKKIKSSKKQPDSVLPAILSLYLFYYFINHPAWTLPLPWARGGGQAAAAVMVKWKVAPLPGAVKGMDPLGVPWGVHFPLTAKSYKNFENRDTLEVGDKPRHTSDGPLDFLVSDLWGNITQRCLQSWVTTFCWNDLPLAPSCPLQLRKNIKLQWQTKNSMTWGATA